MEQGQIETKLKSERQSPVSSPALIVDKEEAERPPEIKMEINCEKEKEVKASVFGESPNGKEKVSSPLKKRIHSPVVVGKSSSSPMTKVSEFSAPTHPSPPAPNEHGFVGSGPTTPGFGFIQSAAAARAAWLLLTNGASQMTPPGYPSSPGGHFMSPGANGVQYLPTGPPPALGGSTYWRM